MSVTFSQIPHALILDPGITLSAVRVWHVIYVETLGRPGWDLSHQQIADKIHADRSTAKRAVALLVEKGWIVRIPQKDSDGDDRPNLYAVCREPHVPWSAEVGASTPPPGGMDAPPPRGIDAPHRDSHYPDTKHVHPVAPAEPDPFDGFWEAYPRKQGKKPAREKFKAAVKAHGLEKVRAGFVAHRAWLEEQHRRGYCPMAATWLNQERYLDEPEIAKPQPVVRRDGSDPRYE